MAAPPDEESVSHISHRKVSTSKRSHTDMLHSDDDEPADEMVTTKRTNSDPLISNDAHDTSGEDEELAEDHTQTPPMSSRRIPKPVRVSDLLLNEIQEDEDDTSLQDIAERSRTRLSGRRLDTISEAMELSSSLCSLLSSAHTPSLLSSNVSICRGVYAKNKSASLFVDQERQDPLMTQTSAILRSLDGTRIQANMSHTMLAPQSHSQLVNDDDPANDAIDTTPKLSAKLSAPSNRALFNMTNFNHTLQTPRRISTTNFDIEADLSMAGATCSTPHQSNHQPANDTSDLHSFARPYRNPRLSHRVSKVVTRRVSAENASFLTRSPLNIKTSSSNLHDRDATTSSSINSAQLVENDDTPPNKNRPRRKAAPTMLCERRINVKLRQTDKLKDKRK